MAVSAPAGDDESTALPATCAPTRHVAACRSASLRDTAAAMHRLPAPGRRRARTACGVCRSGRAHAPAPGAMRNDDALGAHPTASSAAPHAAATLRVRRRILDCFPWSHELFRSTNAGCGGARCGRGTAGGPSLGGHTGTEARCPEAMRGVDATAFPGAVRAGEAGSSPLVERLRPTFGQEAQLALQESQAECDELHAEVALLRRRQQNLERVVEEQQQVIDAAEQQLQQDWMAADQERMEQTRLIEHLQAQVDQQQRRLEASEGMHARLAAANTGLQERLGVATSRLEQQERELEAKERLKADHVDRLGVEVWCTSSSSCALAAAAAAAASSAPAVPNLRSKAAQRASSWARAAWARKLATAAWVPSTSPTPEAAPPAPPPWERAAGPPPPKGAPRPAPPGRTTVAQ